jgi:aryl-alcohol dehydrogenase-like predicted oxidoreductase
MESSEQDRSALTVELGRTGMRVPRLGMGAMVWGDMRSAPWWAPARSVYGVTSSAADQRDALEAALASGVNLVDTAAQYGKGISERRVGELAEGKDVLIATKFPLGFLARTSQLPATLEWSLDRLRRSTIDLYQVHFPSRWMSIPGLMGHMADAVEAGKIRAVGVSNYSAAQMRVAHEALGDRGIPLASNQVQYSLLHRRPEVDGVLSTCRELGVTLIAYMPLASGALTGKYTPENRPQGWRRHMGFFRSGMTRVVAVNELLRDIAERHDRAPSQVALRWLVQQDGVVPIPGAKNGRQATLNAGALSFSLADAEIDALDRATRA